MPGLLGLFLRGFQLNLEKFAAASSTPAEAILSAILSIPSFEVERANMSVRGALYDWTSPLDISCHTGISLISPPIAHVFSPLSSYSGQSLPKTNWTR